MDGGRRRQEHRRFGGGHLVAHLVNAGSRFGVKIESVGIAKHLERTVEAPCAKRVFERSVVEASLGIGLNQQVIGKPEHHPPIAVDPLPVGQERRERVAVAVRPHRGHALDAGRQNLGPGVEVPLVFTHEGKEHEVRLRNEAGLVQIEEQGQDGASAPQRVGVEVVHLEPVDRERSEKIRRPVFGVLNQRNGPCRLQLLDVVGRDGAVHGLALGLGRRDMSLQAHGHRRRLRTGEHQRGLGVGAGQPARDRMTIALDQRVALRLVVEKHIGILGASERLGVITQHHPIVLDLTESTSKVIETGQVDLIVRIPWIAIARIMGVHGVRMDQATPIQKPPGPRSALGSVDDDWLFVLLSGGLVVTASAANTEKHEADTVRLQTHAGSIAGG